jgi:hypothetical protein
MEENQMPEAKIHITADVPPELVERVDDRVKKLGVKRSFAIRKGLELFLRVYRQDLTETVNPPDAELLRIEVADAAVST